jgi:hypothetical protein
MAGVMMHNPVAVVIVAVFGVLGYIMEANGYPVAALVLGIVMGPMVEHNLVTSLIKSDGSVLPFVERPSKGSELLLPRRRRRSLRRLSPIRLAATRKRRATPRLQQAALPRPLWCQAGPAPTDRLRLARTTVAPPAAEGPNRCRE